VSVNRHRLEITESSHADVFFVAYNTFKQELISLTAPTIASKFAIFYSYAMATSTVKVSYELVEQLAQIGDRLPDLL